MDEGIPWEKVFEPRLILKISLTDVLLNRILLNEYNFLNQKAIKKA